MDRRAGGALLVLACSFLLLYREVLQKLVSDWSTDDNYSHGFLVVPVAAYLIWTRQERLRRAALRPSGWGLAVVAAGLGLLAAGTLGSELFLSRVSMLLVMAGTVLFVLGPEHFRITSFPLGFLLLGIPLPAIVFNQVAFPLQLVASRLGVDFLTGIGVPALREGNIIVLAATQLEVAEACSGIRSLVSLLTLGLVLGYVADPSLAVRAVTTIAAFPVAVLVNGLRVAGTGAAAHYYGPEVAEGFFHVFSGWLVFGVALALLLVVTVAARSAVGVLQRCQRGGT